MNQKTFLSKTEISPFGPPPCAGIYFVCQRENHDDNERVLYIGRSNHIKDRVSSNKHPYKTAFKTYNGSVYLRCYTKNNTIELEGYLIRLFQPIMNKNGKK